MDQDLLRVMLIVILTLGISLITAVYYTVKNLIIYNHKKLEQKAIILRNFYNFIQDRKDTNSENDIDIFILIFTLIMNENFSKRKKNLKIKMNREENCKPIKNSITDDNIEEIFNML